MKVAIAQRDVVAGLSILVAYVAAGVFSLQWTAVKGAGAAIWIPAGIGMAGLLFWGVRLWPAIFIGRLVAAYLSGTQQPLWAEITFAAGNSLTTALGVWMLQGRSGVTPPLNELRTMLRFLLGTALVPAALAALIGTSCLYFSSGLAAQDLPVAWLRWLSGNAASVTVITGLAVSWRQEPITRQAAPGFTAMLAVSGVAAALVFMTGRELPLLTWHIYPVLIWAALAYGTTGAASALLIAEGFAVAGALSGVGPFTDLDPRPVAALFYLQQFLVLTASTILLLAAVAHERRGKVALERAQAELSALNNELEARVQERTAALRSSQNALLQAQKMEAVGQLTGGIAHDFNNLLQTITTSFELITRRVGSAEEVLRYAHTGRRATQQGVKLTRQLLTFSRKQDLEMRSIPVKPLIEGTADLLRSTVGSAVTVEFELAGASGLNVFSDPTQLELMIINLAVNARDAMPSGGRLTVGAAQELVVGDPEVQDGTYARIWVRDTGHGMTEEIAARVFEPFFTTKGVGKGTGLGLSMVYGVAKQTGGKASIDSAPGQGTTVSVFLPLVGAAPQQPDTAAGHVPLLPQGLRVLLVDDDEGVRTAIADMLEALGCKVRAVDSGAAALAHIQRELPDLIVLDHTMPGMLGSEFVLRLRSLGVTTPIVLATGDASIERMQVENLEMLRKPFRVVDLQTAVAVALGRIARDHAAG